MSNLEFYLIICALLMPFAALIIIKPKFKKKDKAKSSTVTKPAKVEEKKEEPAPVVEENKAPKEPTPVQKEPKLSVFEDEMFSIDDFSGYLEQKQANITKPKEKRQEGDVTFSLDEFLARKKKGKQEDQTSESFNDLPEDVQVMILTGVLDKKYFD